MVQTHFIKAKKGYSACLGGRARLWRSLERLTEFLLLTSCGSDSLINGCLRQRLLDGMSRRGRRLSVEHGAGEAASAAAAHERTLRPRPQPRATALRSGYATTLQISLASECDLAATNSRLPPDSMVEAEEAIFPQYARTLEASSTYIRCRNFILALWLRNPVKYLEYTRVAEVASIQGRLVNIWNSPVLRDAYEFLQRYRYINFGILPLSPQPSSKQSPRIIVIGAGIAGLSAARELLNLYRHHPTEAQPVITVLEGRKRVGGRIFTLPLHTRAQGEEHPSGVDLAAQIVTGFEDGNPLDVIIMKQSQLPVHFLYNANECQLYDYNGEAVDQRVDMRCEELFNEILEQACHTVMEDGRRYVVTGPRVRTSTKTPADIPRLPLPSLGEMFDYHLSRHPKRVMLRPLDWRLINWHIANLEFANAASIDQLSLYNWDQASHLGQKIGGGCFVASIETSYPSHQHGFEGDHAMIPGGYGQVPHAYAFGMDSEHAVLDIKFEKTVDLVSVDPVTGEVTVECADESLYQCDALVMTVPLGILKSNSIVFDPPLPAWKRGAIDRLGMGWFNKVILVFERRFWPADMDSFGALSEPEDRSDSTGGLPAYTAVRGRFFLFWNVDDLNLYPTTRLPVLCSFIAGEAAVEMEADDDETIVNKAMTVLSRIFPYEHPLPPVVEQVVTRWSRDEFARGSYSYVANGASGDDYDHLARPTHGNIFWAGEATCRQHPATVHGALLSGMRVAQEVGDLFLGPLQGNSI
ncbi:uncharacterized protein SPPG_03593 [Spizellomyces punctatus DAOM BR117]|uniref:SWIRM domain-containing protein n=1 Tax=Spizellomyces punctatus (strain DAOM BR117) TaxID=645134 RepID=A0A0L0HL01_SPIPD|nr:uncharacterized protein SPPG_03593 [Spizellomyces punctatus DAOM BR117]KND01802.1 hypothetical protein SPPG_03593 [Spizellomyces punctatus DAOM BR117]|eukprot:XP_016609841.1 hypothetical protein SPPG_03593 [Spizellomyces punctatus DAOM BR117]